MCCQSGPGEIPTKATKSATNHSIYCYDCQKECINQCQLQGREVSQVECNFWGEEPAVCKCCCGLPSPTPPPKPIAWDECPIGETNKFIFLSNSSIDCNICVNQCKTECAEVGATVTREACLQNFDSNSKELIEDNLLCPCSCKPSNWAVELNIEVSSIPGQKPCSYKLSQ
ncbi:hypothetical protein MKW92_004037 [Papaver armeniacum]|nr:hypothetical protein MKW92_004037 [Papaver armeniacum]